MKKRLLKIWDSDAFFTVRFIWILIFNPLTAAILIAFAAAMLGEPSRKAREEKERQELIQDLAKAIKEAEK